jgi:hypothetical protein
MSVIPNTGRTFTFASVKEYYDAKMRIFPESDTPPLTDPGTESVEALALRFEAATPTPSIDVCPSWETTILNLKDTTQKETLWKFRDYVFTTSMIWVGNQLSSSTGPFQIGGRPERMRPPAFDIGQNTFTILGSKKLTSDIDVTIQGPGCQFIIMIVEDLFHILKEKHGIPLGCMDIEFYMDFRILKTIYVNVSSFTKEEHIEILKYAYIGYFRSLDSKEPTVSTLARTLGQRFIELLYKDVTLPPPPTIDTIIEEAWVKWSFIAPGHVIDRERFYAIATKIDNETREIYALLHPPHRLRNAVKKVMGPKLGDVVTQITKDKKEHSLANHIFFDIADADVHSSGSYILASTAIHVVDIEQKEVSDKNVNLSVSRFFGQTPATGVESFTYIASAIEQLGYLEHYHPAGTPCSMKGIKYVGRLIRALEKANLLDNPTLKDTYTSLNLLRKSDGECKMIIPDLMDTINTLLSTTAAGAAGGGRGRRYTKTRKNKKVTKRRHTRSRRNHGNRR